MKAWKMGVGRMVKGRMVLWGTLLVVMLVLLPSPRRASSKVYKWVDEEGQWHFTDNLSRIPQGVRVEEREYGPPSPPPTRLETPKKEAEPTTQEEQEEWLAWQERLMAIQEELGKKRSEEQDIERELRRPKYKILIRRARLLRQRLTQLREEIGQLEREETEIRERMKAYDR